MTAAQLVEIVPDKGGPECRVQVEISVPDGHDGYELVRYNLVEPIRVTGPEGKQVMVFSVEQV